MNIFYAGNFKSATEPFRREEMSEQNRLQTREFLESMVGQYKDDVAQSREISVEDIDRIMNIKQDSAFVHFYKILEDS